MDAGPQRWLRMFAWTAAGVVTTLALLVGAARLLLPMVPSYQDDIRAWASAATGYGIAFGGISASWPLSGPELTFVDVSLTRPGEPRPVVTAREFSIGLSFWRSLRAGAPRPGRVAVRGSTLRVERAADGSLLVQGRRLAELLPPSSPERPELDLSLGDIAVTYVDGRRRPQEIRLGLRRLTADVRQENIAATLSITLPAPLGRELDVELSLPLPLPEPLALPPDWDARIQGRGLDLPGLLAWGTGDAGALRAGGGDVVLRVTVRGGRAEQVTAEADLKDLAVGSAVSATAYERVSGSGRWQRDAGGWDAAVTGLRLRRAGREAPPTTGELQWRAASGEAPARWIVSASFLRLDDLFPLARAALAGSELAQRLPRELGGDLSNLAAEFDVSAGQATRYSVRLGFARLVAASSTGEVGVSGLTGRFAADGDGGRLELDSSEVVLTLARWFRNPLPARSLQGLLVWRRAPEGMRFLSDDVRLKTGAMDISSRLELVFPVDGSSPVLDLKARASATEAPQVLRYLPLRHFPPQVVDWLERAVVAGRVPSAEGVFRGPLSGFPFDHGEGQFRVSLELQDGTLDYAPDWPRIEHLDAQVVFDGAGMSSARNQAMVGNLPVRDFAVAIPDMRKGVLTVAGKQRADLGELLGFVRATPVAGHVGPTLERASAAGPVDAALRLALPLTNPAAWDLQLLLDARGCQLGLARLPLDLKNLRGRVRLQNTRFYADGVQAVMLGEPVRIGLAPETAAGGATRAQLVALAGALPVQRLMSTFSLPLREYLDGRLGWSATLRIPVQQDGAAAAPLTVALRSDLRGVASTLPAPLAKDAALAWPAEVLLAFPAPDTLDVSAQLDPPFAAALRLVSAADRWHVERGALHAGPGNVRLPARRGLEVTGQVASLDVGAWLSVGQPGPPVPAAVQAGAGAPRGPDVLFRDFALEAAQLSVAGQRFRDLQVTATRGAEAWQVSVHGPAAEGDIVVPFEATARPMRLDMKKLWLGEEEPGNGGHADPRSLMAMEARVADAALGHWRLGQVELVAARVPDGLQLQRFSSRAPSFTVTGDGSWRVLGNDVAKQQTQLKATLESSNVRETLVQLGFGSAISGKSGRVRAELSWPGAPAGDFLERSTGHIGLEMKSGQVTELDPGSGRLVGLLSIAALPRRLSLDFRDVFDKGLGYDVIEGDFTLGGGSAYTCNVGLSGPAVEIAIVGRTDLDRHSYDQVAVVRPQIATTVLTAGGVVLGGPVGGVTMLLVSQLFRKSLGTLGESYYRVTGGWDKPEVARVQRDEVDAGAFKDCEKEIEAALAGSSPAVAPAPARAPPPER